MSSSTAANRRRERNGLLQRRLTASFLKLGCLLSMVTATGTALGPIFGSALVSLMAACVLFLLGVSLSQWAVGSAVRRL